jgi:hypothetical protein
MYITILQYGAGSTSDCITLYSETQDENIIILLLLSRVSVIKDGIGLVNRFIGYSLVVTTINYNTGQITGIIAHTIKSSILSACFYTNPILTRE